MWVRLENVLGVICRFIDSPLPLHGNWQCNNPLHIRRILTLHLRWRRGWLRRLQLRSCEWHVCNNRYLQRWCRAPRELPPTPKINLDSSISCAWPLKKIRAFRAGAASENILSKSRGKQAYPDIYAYLLQNNFNVMLFDHITIGNYTVNISAVVAFYLHPLAGCSRGNNHMKVSNNPSFHLDSSRNNLTSTHNQKAQ